MKVPTAAELLAVFDRAAKAPVVGVHRELSPERRSSTKCRPPASVVSVDSRSPSIGVTEWKLSNGARVLVKPTDFKADEILFGAYSRGGTSLAPDADIMSARLASQIVGLGGAGNFNRIDLAKKLSGQGRSAGAERSARRPKASAGTRRRRISRRCSSSSTWTSRRRASTRRRSMHSVPRWGRSSPIAERRPTQCSRTRCR